MILNKILISVSDQCKNIYQIKTKKKYIVREINMDSPDDSIKLPTFLVFYIR